MNWFKNLNAMPRLMSSFGVLLVLTLGISYLAISNLGAANDRVGFLYNKDMVGNSHASAMGIDVTSIRGDDLNAIYRVADPAAVESSEKDAMVNIADLHTHLDAADKLFVTPEGIEQLGIVRKALPDYERAQEDLFRALKAKDMASANTALEAAVHGRAIIRAACDKAIEIKQKHAGEKFEANNSAYETARVLLLSACLASLLFGVLLSIFIARGFSIPLGRAVSALKRVADGDLTVSLAVDTKDEVGQMAIALNQAIERLNSTLQEVAESATDALSSSQQLAAASESIASGAQEQAASLEETSASLEEITSAVRQNAENAAKASALACGSRDTTDRNRENTSAIAAMAEISASSAKIAEIISTVDEISFQTNLLAVNAAVEAARAGDEGRGFAVVATEVRSLAQRSAVAAKEIKVLIQDSIRKVERGSELVNRVTQLVTDIAHTSAEQSTGVEQVSSAVTQMDQVTQSNSAQTEELSGTAQALAEQAAHLMKLISAFTLTQDARSERDRSTFPPRASAPAEFIVRPPAPRTEYRRSSKPQPPSKSDSPAKRVQGAAKQALGLRAPAPDAGFYPPPAAADSSFEDF
jgi:methyl-accepting chemotaxis protein